MQSKILVLDDRWQQEHWKDSFDEWLPESVKAVYEESGFKALERLSENPDVKLVFLDLQFENQPEQGEQILNRIKEHYPDLKVIILTSLNDSQLALRLVHDQKKAYYYFFKDALDPDQVKKLIENAIESYDLRADAIRKTDIGMVVGESPALSEVLRLTERASLVDSTVLLTGESGTGKELLARAIHLNSRRSQKPFVAINCGAVPEGLVESELFGHVKGAFTSAVADRRGRFEMADGGTVFLDEIAETTSPLQVKLLRVLELGEFQRVGAEKTTKVGVRVIAATNKILEELVREEKFREDLYYRLNILSIHVPPLRERRTDIPLLVRYFVQKLNNEFGDTKDISDRAIEFLMQFDWPGNIRQLQNVLERAIVNSPSESLDDTDFGFLNSSIIKDSDGNLIDRWIEDTLNGQASWADIRKEFGATGDARKKIMEGIIVALKQKLGGRPSGAEMADALDIKRNHVNQILKSLNLQLRDF
jgi:two-component system NtrC family response regulator